MQRPPVALALTLALALALDTSDVAARPRAAGRVSASVPAADSAVGFRLSDQFGRVHEAAAYRGRPMILVGAGRAGRAAGTAWVETLRGLQPDSAAATAIPVVAVADLRGVPRLLRRFVRGRFPDDRREAVLLDWDGTLARRLGFDAERCTIVIVGPDGRPGARTSSATVDTVVARELLGQAAGLTPAALSGSRP
jgi:hypothetical protein